MTFTDARAATAALRELNESLEARVAERTRERDRTWANSQDLLCVLDADGVLTAVNPAWTTALGWTADELIGRSVLDFLHSDDQARAEMRLRTLRPVLWPRVENRYRHRDGGYRDFSWATTPEGDRIYCSGRDITAEKAAAADLAAAHDALRQAQKMEAVGQLTGGIAHDFNNLLQIVVGNLDLLQRGLPPEPPRLRRAADNALAGAMRAAALTQRLMAFSRQQPLVATAIEVNALVGGMTELIGRSLGETIAVDLRLGTDAGRVEVDPNQLESAILNLAVNARDAMPGGGVLTIATSTRVLDTAAAAALPPGNYVVISVGDTGAGIDTETAARVFEPFFTTKEVGKGTGLGLAMVYGFVKQSRGHVALTSMPGTGTTVDILLPEFTGKLPKAAAVVPSASTRRATILVVEDNDAVRSAAVELLGELGHAVISAGDGPEAVAILESRGADIDLLFTDVVLPGGMTGVDLARVAVTIVPELRVLFTTGYARNAFDDGDLTMGAVLPKPYTFAGLAAQIAATLG